MFSNRVSVILAFFFLVSLPAAACWAGQMPSSGDEDSAGIRKWVAAYTDAFNRHDAQAVGALYAEDSEATISTGITDHGSKEIEAHNAAIFAKNFKVAQRTDTIRSIRFLAPGIASVDDDWTITGSKKPDGTDNPLRKGLLIFVMTKRDGKWQVTIQHEVEFVTAQPPTPQPASH